MLTLKFSRINICVSHSLKYYPSFRTCMDSKSAIFVIVGSLLVMVIYSPITKFVSAEVTSECFGQGSATTYYCVYTFTGGSTTKTWIMECSKDKTGTWDCQNLPLKPKPPGIDQAIQHTINEVGPSNPNDSKDLGGMKTDKGITKSPIE